MILRVFWVVARVLRVLGGCQGVAIYSKEHYKLLLVQCYIVLRLLGSFYAVIKAFQVNVNMLLYSS